MPSIDERLTNLEIKVTYQDDMIETLNQVIIELRKELEIQQTRVRILEERSTENEAEPILNERPPHY